MSKISKKHKLEYPVEIINGFEDFINSTFGEIESVIHSTDPNEDIHIDIYIVPPDKEFPYWKLVTVGMSQYKQNMPEHLKKYFTDRCELVMLLEPDWTYEDNGIRNMSPKNPSVKVNKNSDNNYVWPIQVLKDVSLAPFVEQSFTCLGDIFENELIDDYKNVNLKNVIIKSLQDFKTDDKGLVLPNGEEVEFYQIAFIDKNEMDTLLPMSIGERIIKAQNIDNVLHPDRESIDLS